MSEFVRAAEPADGDERAILLGWLEFHRDALDVKCRGLTDEQLTRRSAEPSRLCLLGIVRHMAEMERAYGAWALGPRQSLQWVWGAYEGDEECDFDCGPADVIVSFQAWREERSRTDQAIAGRASLDEVGDGNRHTTRWNLAKLVSEYARHNGHADIIRERIDGQTGE